MRLGIIDVPTQSRSSVYTATCPFEEKRVGAAAVYCSDGRFGEAMDEFLHDKSNGGLALPHYDRVAIPGGAGCLAGHTCAYHDKNALVRQLEFLIKAHGLRRVVLIAHDGCGFYKDLFMVTRTAEQQQAADLAKAATVIRTFAPNVHVEAYFARKVDGRVAFEPWQCD